MSEQVGLTGKAGSWGIQDTTVGWTGTSARSLTIFTEVSKTPGADIDPSTDNAGERMGHNRRNKRITMRFSAHPKGANAAAARAIAADLPMPGDTVTITCANDAQIASDAQSTTLVDDCSSRETPEGELVVDFTVTKWLGKLFVGV